ncbi:MAG: type II secretion system protein [Phycisphaerales bacterium]
MSLTILVSGVLGLLFLYAGVQKSVAPDAFGKVVWFILGRDLALVRVAVGVGIALAVAEVGLGLSLILWPGSRRLGVATIVLLLVVTGGLIRLAMLSGAPSCGCFGTPRIHGSTEFGVGFARNAGLAWLALLVVARRQSAGEREDECPSQRHGNENGFTIVELLVTIVVMAVLLALVLPMLSGSRDAGERVRRLTVARQLGAAVELYGGDNRGAYPYVSISFERVPPFTSRPTIERPVESLAPPGFSGGYFRPHAWFWAGLLVPRYYAERESIEPEARREHFRSRGWSDRIVSANFTLSNTVVADPRFWEDTDASTWSHQEYLRGTKSSEVLFPGQKGLFIWGIAGPGGPTLGHSPWATGFADGSASALDDNTLLAIPCVTRPYGSVPIGVIATKDGLRGLDVAVR